MGALGALGRRAVAAGSFRNIGAVYVRLLITVLFSVWVPDTFPTVTTVKQVLNGNAVAGLVALSVVLPLAARVFDLSVAYTMSLTSVLTAYFLVSKDLGPATAIALAMSAALLVGVVNGLVVVVLRVDSFIATLATGALIQSLITMVTNDSSITDRRRRPAPHDLPSGGRLDRPALVVRPEPPEHPDQDAAGPADPAGVRRGLAGHGARCRGLLADRAPDHRPRRRATSTSRRRSRARRTSTARPRPGCSRRRRRRSPRTSGRWPRWSTSGWPTG